MLQAKIKGMVYTHALPRATTAPEPASLLWEGSSAATCPRLRTPPPCLGRALVLPCVQGSGPLLLALGGLWCCHVLRGFGPHLTVQEGSGGTTRPSTPDTASPLRRGPALTRVLWLQTAPASVVDFGTDMCPMALHGLCAIEIKESLVAMTCSDVCVFPRDARALPRCLQDMRADSVIMTCKLCRQALQHRAIVHPRDDVAVSQPEA
jgi:hypothetical protein